MDKNKGKKKTTSKSGTKTTKKKSTSKKVEKTTKKKKTLKKNEVEEEQSPENEEGENMEVEVIEQKEQDEDIKEKLNKPLNKKKLPPIDKNNDVQLIEKEKEVEEDIMKDELNDNEQENNNNNNEKKEPVEKVEASVGTPFFYDIGGLKTEVEIQNKKINMENMAQEKYKISLNNLLNDLNKILSENVEYLYDEGEDAMKKQKLEHITNLQNILFSYQHQIKEVKEKNKLYKQHYELLMKQDETRIIQSAKEYEALIEEKKNDNNNLNKKISELKQTSQIGRKKLEAYSENVKYPQDINNLSNQLKTLLKKKADYFSKLNKDIKTIGTCQKELENLEKFYEDKKKKKKLFKPQNRRRHKKIKR